MPADAPLRSVGRGLYRQARKQGLSLLTGRLRPYSHIFYVIESGWSIAHDGQSIGDGLRRLGGPAFHLSRSALGLRRQVVHFGSRNLFMLTGHREADPSNQIAMTWFHGSPADPNPENQAMIRDLAVRQQALAAVVTSSTIARDRLLAWGVPPAKLRLIPLGVDLQMFQPQARAREAARRRLGLTEDQICLGLFHKDGEGWKEGLTPKWVKAPDVFLKVVEQLHTRYPLFVLLTGPARGYVRQGLQRLGVAHAHLQPRRLQDVAGLYQALDLYVIPSREEGGPKALLECMAGGVPVVTTRVGMCADVIRNGENGLMVDVDDAAGLAAAASRLIEGPALRRQLADQALADAQPFDWLRIAADHYKPFYQSLMTGR